MTPARPRSMFMTSAAKTSAIAISTSSVGNSAKKK
jgi:hypothetical protein